MVLLVPVLVVARGRLSTGVVFRTRCRTCCRLREATPLLLPVLLATTIGQAPHMAPFIPSRRTLLAVMKLLVPGRPLAFSRVVALPRIRREVRKLSIRALGPMLATPLAMAQLLLLTEGVQGPPGLTLWKTSIAQAWAPLSAVAIATGTPPLFGVRPMALLLPIAVLLLSSLVRTAIRSTLSFIRREQKVAQ